ncbi:MAG: hypothetical protein ACD_81C00230G0001 [uncultured bacterium]|uniref:Uncharacterized protein n=1 Tax=Candidatus Wolfebacteria bacterium GW2011_GWE2_44_13 TaxID=1619017 RepID=A0A0G1JHE6_9BACT|nr:MAG: hypothetical protein ACD_81C00230G0001 [uncultured bacterium]KKT43432.1 MAG: hypothetical protein UW32_C0001G0024 [Candidatus Wolfebacteria bacterium GW2011_GWE2_44_13]
MFPKSASLQIRVLFIFSFLFAFAGLLFGFTLPDYLAMLSVNQRFPLFMLSLFLLFIVAILMFCFGKGAGKDEHRGMPTSDLVAGQVYRVKAQCEDFFLLYCHSTKQTIFFFSKEKRPPLVEQCFIPDYSGDWYSVGDPPEKS